MSHIQYVDELIREYLLFRGFAGTLKMFDVELKQDKEKGFRVDRIVDQFLQLIYTHDLTAVREFWNHLNIRMFSKLDIEFTNSIKKIENSVLKFFLVNAICSNKPEKVNEFLTKMAPELQNQQEWKDWFLIPFIKNPEENPTFSLYFSRQWQDNLLISIHNLLAIIYQLMPQPALSSYEEEAVRLQKLTEENEMLKARLNITMANNQMPSAPPPIDLMDDFYNIAQETPTISSVDSQVKSLKNLIKSIGGGGAPPSNPVPNSTSTGNSTFSDPKSIAKSRQNLTPTRQIKTASPSSEDMSHITVAKRSASVEGRRVRDYSSHSTSKPTQSFLVLSQEKYTEHKCSVKQCKFNSGGSHVASGDSEGHLKIWTPAPVPKTVCSFKLSAGVTCIDWVKKNERYLMTGTIKGSVHLIDTKEGRVHWENTPNVLNSSNSRVACLACNPVGSTFTCSVVANTKTNMTCALLRFDIKTRKMEHVTAVDNSIIINCLSYNPSGQIVLAGADNGFLYKIDVRQNQVLSKVSLHDSAITSLRIHTDNVSIYSMSSSQIVRSSLNDPNPSERSSSACHWDVGLKSTAQHVFCLNQAGTHLLLISDESRSGTIYRIKRSGMEQVLSLSEHKDRLTACDWRTANQCGTCLISSQDGVISVSTLLSS